MKLKKLKWSGDWDKEAIIIIENRLLININFIISLSLFGL